MAKTQTERRGTSGSQFFIVTARDAPLDPDYAILGRVAGGKTVVRRIARLATDPATESPIDPVVIRSVRIRSADSRLSRGGLRTATPAPVGRGSRARRGGRR